jgi:probable phosphoglycerate mutase
MATAVVVRPGETDFDDQERIQGALDLPLNARGQSRLTETISQLGDARLEVIYASPTEPACTVAQELGAALEVPVRSVEGLRSLNQGLWEGMRLDDVRRKHPRVYKQWRNAPESVCPPEGETCDEAAIRVRQVLRKLLKRKGPFAIVVGEPLASMVSSFLRTGEAQMSGPVCGCEATREPEFVEVARQDGARSRGNGHGDVTPGSEVTGESTP